MVDTRSREENVSRTTTTTSGTSEVYDTFREDAIKVIDELAKVQPQFAQSISNLQLDYIQKQ
jgi:hypothetical protein